MGYLQVVTLILATQFALAHRVGVKDHHLSVSVVLDGDGHASSRSNATEESNAEIYPNGEVAAAFDAYVEQGKKLRMFKKLPQGVLGPLPKDWQNILPAESVLKSLGALDKVGEYKHDDFIGGAISFQLDGDFEADYYPIKASKKSLEWPLRTAQEVRDSSPKVGPALVDHIENVVAADIQKLTMSGDMQFKWVCFEETKYMVQASVLDADKFGTAKEFGIVPSWGGEPQLKDMRRDDTFIVPEDQAAVGNKGKCGGVYMCQQDAKGIPINHIELK